MRRSPRLWHCRADARQLAVVRTRRVRAEQRHEQRRRAVGDERKVRRLASAVGGDAQQPARQPRAQRVDAEDLPVGARPAAKHFGDGQRRLEQTARGRPPRYDSSKHSGGGARAVGGVPATGANPTSRRSRSAAAPFGEVARARTLARRARGQLEGLVGDGGERRRRRGGEQRRVVRQQARRGRRRRRREVPGGGTVVAVEAAADGPGGEAQRRLRGVVVVGFDGREDAAPVERELLHALMHPIDGAGRRPGAARSPAGRAAGPPRRHTPRSAATRPGAPRARAAAARPRAGTRRPPRAAASPPTPRRAAPPDRRRPARAAERVRVPVGGPSWGSRRPPAASASPTSTRSALRRPGGGATSQRAVSTLLWISTVARVIRRSADGGASVSARQRIGRAARAKRAARPRQRRREELCSRRRRTGTGRAASALSGAPTPATATHSPADDDEAAAAAAAGASALRAFHGAIPRERGEPAWRPPSRRAPAHVWSERRASESWRARPAAPP